MDKTTIGDRMKEYERCCETTLVRRLPVIIRCDGKNFSKFTKKIKAKKPFDDMFCHLMSTAMQHAASKIEGCVFGYTQSDEITFVLRNDQSLESVPWFGNRLQKICSVVSSMVTAAFNSESILSGVEGIAYFDTRVFVVPSIQEAINVCIWRQNDAVKNSISAACYYEIANKVGKKTARKMMYKCNQNQQQELLFRQTEINWNDYPVKFKRGIGCYKVYKTMKINDNECVRTFWELDTNLPIFTKDTNFLRNIFLGEEGEV